TLPLSSLLPHVNVAWALLASLVVVVAWPRVGLPLHVATLAFAIAIDQVRIQPEWISLAVLLVATGPWRWSRTLGWAHLASMWFWSGLNKALSSGFTRSIPVLVAHNIGWRGAAGFLAFGIPAMEIGLGLLAAWTRTRWWAGVGGALLHGTTIFVLHMGFGWTILWWNVGLAFAAIVLLTDRRPDPTLSWTGPIRGVRDAAIVALFLYPAGSYLGVVDPYLAHHVYTQSTPRGIVCTKQFGCSSNPIDLTGAALKAPIPPAPRLLEEWFRRVCHRGDTLEVVGLRVRPFLRGLAGAADYTYRCPSR
ncbi:MAG TPA: hypothetical protein VGM93_04120, partial [Acidimicrobiales bacterium]